MAATFFLMLREGLEAALIVGIIAAYLVKIGRNDELPKVWAGVGAALGLSIVAGIVIVATIGRLPLVVQETLGGVAGLIAVAGLPVMLFWMRRQGRAMKGELERGVDAALTAGGTMALVGLAFVAVIREGLETPLFVLALIPSLGASPTVPLGGILGLAVAVGVGWAIFVGGRRAALGRFSRSPGAALCSCRAG